MRKYHFLLWLNGYKTPCIECGEKNPDFIRFIHRYGEQKFKVDNACWSRSKASVAEEILKCVCICTACTKKRRRNTLLRIPLKQYREAINE